MRVTMVSSRALFVALAVAAVQLGIAAFAQSANAQPVGQVSEVDPYIHRSNFVVADLEQAFKVYRDVLGLKVDVNMEVKPDSFMYDVFKIDRKAVLRIAFLSSPDKRFGAIGLTEVKGVDLPEAKVPNPSVLILEIHGRMEKVYADVKALGLEQTQIYELQNPSRREFIFSDFDGNRILIMQLHAAD